MHTHTHTHTHMPKHLHSVANSNCCREWIKRTDTMAWNGMENTIDNTIHRTNEQTNGLCCYFSIDRPLSTTGWCAVCCAYILPQPVSAFWRRKLFSEKSIAIAGYAMEHQIQTHPKIQSCVCERAHAAPPLWHGIFSYSAIGGKLSIASLLGNRSCYVSRLL